MLNKENIKEFCHHAGIKIEITEEYKQNCFVVKVKDKKNVYIWENGIVSKEEFAKNLLQFIIDNKQ